MAHISSENRRYLVQRKDDIRIDLQKIKGYFHGNVSKRKELREERDVVKENCKKRLREWKDVPKTLKSQHNEAQPDTMQTDVEKLRDSLKQSHDEINSLIRSHRAFRADWEKRLLRRADELLQLCQDWEQLLKDHHKPQTPEAVVQSGQDVEGVGQEARMVEMEEHPDIPSRKDLEQLRQLLQDLQTSTDQEQKEEVQNNRNTDDQDRNVDQLLEDMRKEKDRITRLCSRIEHKITTFNDLLAHAQSVVMKLNVRGLMH